ncbi:MAG: flagellar hook capping FlgD N-terminal domain-containing protein [Arthrobacter sp.]
MPIEAVTAPRDAGLHAGAPARAPKQALDGEVFMQLLVTQLQNQDPSSPMDTNEMIAQTTQLAMMEKLNQLSASAEENFSLQMRSAAADLIGRQVTYAGADGQATTGLVTAVSYAGKVPTVTLNGQSVALDAVTGLAATSAS